MAGWTLHGFYLNEAEILPGPLQGWGGEAHARCSSRGCHQTCTAPREGVFPLACSGRDFRAALRGKCEAPEQLCPLYCLDPCLECHGDGEYKRIMSEPGLGGRGVGPPVNSHRPACPPAPSATPPAPLERIPSTPVLLCLLALSPVRRDPVWVGCLVVMDEQCQEGLPISFLRAARTWNARLSRRSEGYGGWTVLRAESHSSTLREGPGCDPSVNLGSAWLKARGLLQPAPSQGLEIPNRFYPGSVQRSPGL